MLCPQCSHSDHRATSINSRLDDQIVRRRACQSCGHAWFTVEVIVPNYAVGWSKGHLRKPVLRVPVTVQAGHTEMQVSHVEAKDQMDALARGRRTISERADRRHRVKQCDSAAA
jgi:transcriptional regulator NrdR family protein